MIRKLIKVLFQSRGGLIFYIEGFNMAIELELVD